MLSPATLLFDRASGTGLFIELIAEREIDYLVDESNWIYQSYIFSFEDYFTVSSCFTELCGWFACQSGVIRGSFVGKINYHSCKSR
jgi:hypothetical protein